MTARDARVAGLTPRRCWMTGLCPGMTGVSRRSPLLIEYHYKTFSLLYTSSTLLFFNTVTDKWEKVNLLRNPNVQMASSSVSLLNHNFTIWIQNYSLVLNLILKGQKGVCYVYKYVAVWVRGPVNKSSYEICKDFALFFTTSNLN